MALTPPAIPPPRSTRSPSSTARWPASSYLPPGVIEHAERWRRSYDIVGVYAVGETLVEPTGLVADYFGLPFPPGLRAARACRNKYLQRWYLPTSARCRW